MKKVLIILFLSLFILSFISADTCSDMDKTLEEFNLRLNSVESKIDNTENNYQLIPSVLQKLNNMETDLETKMNQKDGLAIYLIPGSIVFILLITLIIVVVRNK